MHQLLFGTTVVAAFLGGVVALFAPCCISVMLPAYLATGLHRRRQLVAMTFVFAAGVGAVILPVSFGATALSRLINGQHFIVYSVMAVTMIVMGAFMALGFKVPLPMIGVRPSQAGGVGRAFVLGMFSGVATACCAPVLAGVVALSGAASSFVTALVIGVAYVFGMVTPLFLIAVVWDRRHDAGHRRSNGHVVTLRLLGITRSVAMPAFFGGLLLIAMGVLVGILAVTGPNMGTRGWQASMSSKLQHGAHVATTWFGHLPGWTVLLFLVSAVVILARVAIHQIESANHRDEHTAVDDDVMDDATCCNVTTTSLTDAAAKSDLDAATTPAESPTQSMPVANPTTKKTRST
ncbi:MAG: cytochrome c biogenesis CcdA family protein [Acidimicrobiales bacterium]